MGSAGIKFGKLIFHKDEKGNEEIRFFEGQKRSKYYIKKSFESSYGGMIVSQNNMVFSFCPHHFLPVAYRITLAYIPDENGRVLGISKLPRICVLLAGRPVLQVNLNYGYSRYIFN